MYKKPLYRHSLINVVNTVEGETIETKVARILKNKEPLENSTPLIYTEKKDGVNAAYNIRTDRWEIATEAMNKILKSKEAKTESIPGKDHDEESKVFKIGEPKSTDGKQQSK